MAEISLLARTSMFPMFEARIWTDFSMAEEVPYCIPPAPCSLYTEATRPRSRISLGTRTSPSSSVALPRTTCCNAGRWYAYFRRVSRGAGRLTLLLWRLLYCLFICESECSSACYAFA
jgi:hypothetical protein